MTVADTKSDYTNLSDCEFDVACILICSMIIGQLAPVVCNTQYTMIHI